MIKDLAEQYSYKLKTVKALLEEVGSFPRTRKVIMCHGVFDVVHPGHLRHLIYAKSKADVLVASLTADIHIAKGTHRPHVPQELRALSLAAYDIVDFVIIDPHPTPVENLKAIKPEFFAKGYEYVSSGLSAKTAEENEIVDAYGGEIVFSPGDVIYSSSNLIKLAPPEIKTEKLLSLMGAEDISFDMLYECLDGMGQVNVHVVGDTIVDTITLCTLIGSQSKTPTMSVRYEDTLDFVGGAGIVAKHIRATGASVTFSTVLGEDERCKFVLGDLKGAGVLCAPVIDVTRPTTNKNAIVVDGYRLIKVDTVDNSSINDSIVEMLGRKIHDTESDAVVFSDFRHGIFNRRTTPRLVDVIPSGVLRVADSQVASRWGNILDFKGFDLITPNEREARFALGDQDTGIRPLAAELYDTAECKMLILKLGDKGVLTCRTPDHASANSFFLIDSFVDQLQDPVGAGDALLAYSTLSLLVTKGNATVSAILGSIAAAVECEFDGNRPVTVDKVREKIDQISRRTNYQS